MTERLIPPATSYPGLLEITHKQRTFTMLGDPAITRALLEAHVARVTKEA